MPLIKIESVEEQQNKRNKAIKYIQSQTSFCPEVMIILGSGLGKMTHEIEVETYYTICGYPLFSTIHSKNPFRKAMVWCLSRKESNYPTRPLPYL